MLTVRGRMGGGGCQAQEGAGMKQDKDTRDHAAHRDGYRSDARVVLPCQHMYMQHIMALFAARSRLFAMR